MFICLTVCSRRYGFESHRPVQKQLLVLKQFNLEKYLKNPELKIVTRDGRSAQIICTDADCGEGPIVAIVTRANGESKLLCYYDNGRYFLGRECNEDLFFAPNKHEGWINIFSHISSKFIFGHNIIDSSYLWFCNNKKSKRKSKRRSSKRKS